MYFKTAYMELHLTDLVNHYTTIKMSNSHSVMYTVNAYITVNYSIVCIFESVYNLSLLHAIGLSYICFSSTILFNFIPFFIQSHIASSYYFFAPVSVYSQDVKFDQFVSCQRSSKSELFRRTLFQIHNFYSNLLPVLFPLCLYAILIVFLETIPFIQCDRLARVLKVIGCLIFLFTIFHF